MATTLKELIEDIEKDDLPTNEFTIEDKDPMVILGKINEVIASLKMIQDTINSSDTKAQEALTTAIQALDTANQALSSSNISLETANQAIATANQAIATANTALQESQNAVDTSNQANNTANTAETNSLEALKVAQEALDQVVQALGTKAYINNVLQNRLDFTEDPQTQINEIALAKLPKEYAMQVNTGGTAEYIHIGSFPIYDTNITVDISCTATSTFTGRVVFPCTNHVVNTPYVYGDPYRELSSRLFYSLQNNTIDLYFQAPEYQKLMYKVWYDTAGDAEPTVDGSRLSTLPSTATNTIPNALDRTSQLRIGGTVATLGVVSNLNTISQPVNSTVTYSFGGGCANAPITDSGMVIQMQESYSYCTQLVIANDADASTWRRSYRDGTWTAWEKLVKLKSITFTSTADFFNFMQENIDSVSEVVIIPSDNITGNRTNLAITSSASTFTNSSGIPVLSGNFEYRFRQFIKKEYYVQLEGGTHIFNAGEGHAVATLNSEGMFTFSLNTLSMTPSAYIVNQVDARGQYSNLTFKVYYFD